MNHPFDCPCVMCDPMQVRLDQQVEAMSETPQQMWKRGDPKPPIRAPWLKWPMPYQGWWWWLKRPGKVDRG
jgi:hypothetical protein